MKHVLAVTVKARFSLRAINDFWISFNQQFADNPTLDIYHVGRFTDWKRLNTLDVLVTLDPDRTVARLGMSNDI
jgi:hypothetical protein